jgi:hypothetical protein
MGKRLFFLRAFSMGVRVAVIALTLLPAMLLLSSSLAPRVTTAAPPEQPFTDLCSLFPPGNGFKVGTNVPGKSCSASYQVGDLLIERYDDAATARQQVTDFCSTDPTRRSTAEYGEIGFEVAENASKFKVRPKNPDAWEPGTAVGNLLYEDSCETGSLLSPPPCQNCARGYRLIFARGCYVVSATAKFEDQRLQNLAVLGAANAMRSIATQVDAKLKTMPPCPGAQPPAAGIFGVGHGCSYNEPPTTAAGQLRCAAGTINEPPGADLFDIVFEWTYDGATVPNESKEVYARDDKDITPGEHTVTVVAIDKRTDSRSEASTFRFTKPGADLAVTVQCALRSGQNDAVACYADPENVPEGATLTYEWTWDGALQGETGRTLPKDKLADGLYIITVRATDSNSGKTAQGSTTVQVGTASAQPPASSAGGQLQTTMPSGTQTANPGAKTTINFPPGSKSKAELKAQCENKVYTLLYIALVTGNELVKQGALANAILMQILCDKITAVPQQIARAGQPRHPLLLEVAPDIAVQIQIELAEGAIQLEVVNAQVAVDAVTSAATISAVGRNTFEIAHDPATNASFVSVSQGQVTVQPKNSALQPFTLQPGKQVQVTQNNVSAVSAIPTSWTHLGGLASLAVRGGVAGLGLLALLAGFVTFTRSRARQARPSPPPPSGIPERGQRPSDLPERGAQRKPPKPTDLPER